MKETICYCLNISRAEIEAAVSCGAKTLKEIKEKTGACTGNQCDIINPNGRCCSPEILSIIKKQSDNRKDQCTCCSD